MPAEQTQLDYYRYYIASQHRVKQWVQETSKELRERERESECGDFGGASGNPPAAAHGERHRKSVEGEREATRRHRVRASGRASSSSPNRRASNEDPSRSRSRPSTRSKRVKGLDKSGHVKESPRIRGTKQRTTSASVRRTSTTDVSLASYLPYAGVLPLLLVTGFSTLSTLAMAILLAGYMFIDYPTQPAKKSERTLDLS